MNPVAIGMDLGYVRRQTGTRPLHWYPSLSTTMAEAARLARAGCPSGTVVGAEEQTAGIGRHGRGWHSPAGDGLYLSVIVRLPFPAENFPALTLAMGLATMEAIQLSAGLDCDLRWPNDVLVGGNKAAGILVQLEPAALIVGVGINVNHAEFPGELAGTATSLRRELGHPVLREPLLVALLRRIDAWCGLIASEGIAPVLAHFTRASSYVRGRRVRADGSIQGVTDGLDGQGFLWVRKDSGERVRVLTGGVRPQ
jgi:BirA family biotin operon repressor/biotin-[acetyl-CoA-carboxylase] ligase